MRNVFTLLFLIAATMPFGAVAVVGCAASRNPGVAGVSDAVESVVHGTEVICESAQELVDVGMDVPGAAQCGKILPLLSGEDVITIIAVLNCGKTFSIETESKAFALCAVDRGWNTVEKRIQKVIEKSARTSE